MSQNVCLAVASLGIRARYVASVDRVAVAASLAPVCAADIIGAMAIGRQ